MFFPCEYFSLCCFQQLNDGQNEPRPSHGSDTCTRNRFFVFATHETPRIFVCPESGMLVGRVAHLLDLLAEIDLTSEDGQQIWQLMGRSWRVWWFQTASHIYSCWFQWGPSIFR